MLLKPTITTTELAMAKVEHNWMDKRLRYKRDATLSVDQATAPRAKRTEACVRPRQVGDGDLVLKKVEVISINCNGLSVLTNFNGLSILTKSDGLSVPANSSELSVPTNSSRLLVPTNYNGLSVSTNSSGPSGLGQFMLTSA
ncbi:hypothetical protein BHM03_00034039 [Ensete ventricosum]|nr:hypothetical protein BHM03_00034039 [Ensete ventricosum]